MPQADAKSEGIQNDGTDDYSDDDTDNANNNEFDDVLNRDNTKSNDVTPRDNYTNSDDEKKSASVGLSDILEYTWSLFS